MQQGKITHTKKHYKCLKQQQEKQQLKASKEEKRVTTKNQESKMALDFSSRLSASSQQKNTLETKTWFQIVKWKVRIKKF